jgi:outer membrane protein assembly factor BamB
MDWPTYGRTPRHTFQGLTTLTKDSVSSLQQRWFFRTGDAVTAQPILVNGIVYVGSWDCYFYAIDLATGHLKWKYRVKSQPAVHPLCNQRSPEDATSDGGMITSSAYYLPAGRTHPALVIFGGGYTMYALRAKDGRPYWIRDFTGRPEQRPKPDDDPTRIFSSPVVVGNHVLFGVSPDGEAGYRGYFVSASLRTGKLQWRFETNRRTGGKVPNDGCGGVWSSATLDRFNHLITIDVADCNFQNPPPYAESVLALGIKHGKLVWRYRPPRGDSNCDWDFGATTNLGLRNGRPTFLGVGAKDGTYYSLTPATGKLRWKTNVVFGGFAGGFIATAAYDGNRVYGATALGDFGRFEGVGQPQCQPNNPRDQPIQEPSMHAFDAKTGRVVWQAMQSQSFAPTTVAGGMTWNGTATSKQVLVRDAGNGNLLSSISLPASCYSPVTVAGNAVLFGTGSPEQGSPAGVYLYTPGGGTPAVP